MSNPIVRYAIARENGFFKVEQVQSSTQALTARLAMPSLPQLQAYLWADQPASLSPWPLEEEHLLCARKLTFSGIGSEWSTQAT